MADSSPCLALARCKRAVKIRQHQVKTCDVDKPINERAKMGISVTGKTTPLLKETI